MLYDEGLDYEQCHNLPVAAERFYEDILTPNGMSGEDLWKKPPMSVGLPTPPSTPEKSSLRLRGSLKLIDTNALNMHLYNSPVHQSPNNNLQVVPDAITGEDVQDFIPFLTDLGNRSMASPNFFDTAVSQGQCNSQTKRSPPPCTPSESIVHSPSFQAEQNNHCGFQDPDQSFTHNGCLFSDVTTEGSFSITTYRDIQAGSGTTTVPTCISSMRETVVPECMLSPVSPSKPLKRSYSAISTVPNSMQRNPSIMNSPVVRKLDFLDDLTHNSAQIGRNQVTQNIGQLHHNHNVGTLVPSVGAHSLASLQQSDQYLRQIKIETVENFRKVDDTEKNGGETELSRATHNVLERQRRNDLKMRFHILRDNLPDLMNNEKAPKIQILKKAYEFTQELKAQEQRLLADKELERQRKFILLRRLHALRQGFFDY
ncbi:transcriptional regulator Myc-A-like isoform X2 [Rhopilema esculentum]|eukprot:gene11532-21753_t